MEYKIGDTVTLIRSNLTKNHAMATVRKWLRYNTKLKIVHSYGDDSFELRGPYFFQDGRMDKEPIDLFFFKRYFQKWER